MSKTIVKKFPARIMQQINNTHGAGTIQLGSEMQFPRLPRISTGIFSLDVETGGGWPRSRLHHIYGAFSTGKSLVAYLASAEFQKYCFWCTQPLTACSCGAKQPNMTAWIDIENTDDPIWRRKLGVADEMFYKVNAEYGEQCVDIIDALIRSGEVGLIVVDSVAAITRTEQVTKSAEQNQSPGSLARLMTLATRKWQAALNNKLTHPTQKITVDGKQVPKPWDNLTTIFCLNQIREHIGSIPMPASPPGGHALRHAASIELKTSFSGSDLEWEDDATESGEQAAKTQTIHFITHKNKTFNPRRSGSFTIDFTTGKVDNEEQIFLYAKRWQIISTAGAWHYFGEQKLGQGEEKAYAAVESDPALFRKIKTAVEAKVKALHEPESAPEPKKKKAVS